MIRLRNARLVDESKDDTGDLLVGEGCIVAVGRGAVSRDRSPEIDIDCAGSGRGLGRGLGQGRRGGLVLMPAFVDLHVHFRDPGFPEKETLESGSMAAVAGGFGTVVAMANTRPATSDPALALAMRARAAALGLVEYFPALSMSRGLAGRDDSHLDDLEAILAGADGSGIRVLSDDGKDLADEALLLAVFRRAAMLDLLASCHCELPGSASDREAEIRGVERAIALGREAGCRLHIAHVSTRESIELVRRAKAEAQAAAAPGTASFRLSCEATPHHLALNSAAAQLLGAHSHGRVNPGLRDEDDRLAVIEGLRDGSIDAIATDHAPHSAADKAGGAPGFSGLETAFALSSSTLGPLGFDLSRLSALMSAVPARILGLTDRGRLDPGMRADLVLVDPDEVWTVDPDRLRSRGKNTPIAGRHLRGRIRLTIHDGRIVYDEL